MASLISTALLTLLQSLFFVSVLSTVSCSGDEFASYQTARILSQTSGRSAEVKLISIDEQDLDFIQFTSSKVGWAGNHYGLLFATEDGGNSWHSKNLKFTGGVNPSYFSSIYFSSAVNGWVLAQKYKSLDEDMCRNEAWLFNTSDGALTWHIQFSRQCVEMIKVGFADSHNGWLLGRQFSIRGSNTESRILVLHTSDGGNTWVDVSDGLNRLIADWKDRVYESPASMAVTDEQSASVITANGYLIDTVDGGKKWRRTGSIRLNTLIPEASRSGRQSISVTGGMDGSHGTAGMWARRDPNGRWIGTWFTQVYVKSAAYLSEDEVIVVGSLLVENTDPKEPSKREGVVLYSKDRGLTWEPLFRSSGVKAVNALYVDERRLIWAVGSGHVLRITLPPNSET